MRLVVDASTLVAELLRKRGRALFARPDLELLVSGQAWEEAERHLRERANLLKGRIAGEAVDELMDAALEIIRLRFEVVPADVYAAHEAVARLRIRDETDWPTLALALAADAAILTSDPDFLGSGVVTWTYETLFAELARRAIPAGEEGVPAEGVRSKGYRIEPEEDFWKTLRDSADLPDEKVGVGIGVASRRREPGADAAAGRRSA